MPKIIYNEGRVVGLSAYELYVKQHYAIDPNKEPATEREWLASTLALGTSMLLKVQPGDKDINNKFLNDSTKTEKTVSVVDYPLPSTSKLCAASTIIGSYFYGEGYVATNSHFATRITSYGELIKNDGDGSPNATSTEGSDVPTGVSTDWPKNMKNQMSGYLSIIDGVVIQPGKWSAAKNTLPQKDLVPNMAGVPTVRLQIKGKIETAFFVLLVGFTNRVVVSGESGIQSGSTNSPSPQDGDFIGPAVFPWGSKIIFTTPNAAINVFMKNKYQRKLPATASTSKIASGMSIIDMEDYEPRTGYSNGYLKPTENKANVPVDIDVEDFATWGNSASILTAYSRNNDYPSVLYGAKIDGTGTKEIYPLDVAAPGTVKMFESGATKEVMQKYESAYPGTTALRHNSDGTISIVHDNSIYMSSPKVSVAITKDPKNDKAPYIAETTVKPQNPNDPSITIKAISLQDKTRSMLNTSGSSGSVNIQLNSQGGDIGSNSVTYSGSFNWTDLLDMLANNKKANLSMTMDKVNLNEFTTTDITDVFAGVDYVDFAVNPMNTVDVTYTDSNGDTKTKTVYTWKHLKLAPLLTSIEDWPKNLAYDGYFQVLFKMYESDFSLTSRFDIVIQIYSKSELSLWNETDSQGNYLPCNPMSYILFRGDDTQIKEQIVDSTAQTSPNKDEAFNHPLFGEPSTSIGTSGTQSSAAIHSHTYTTEPSNNTAFAKLVSGVTILADSANFLWAPNVTLNGTTETVSTNTGLADRYHVNIIDRSFTYDKDAEFLSVRSYKNHNVKTLKLTKGNVAKREPSEFMHTADKYGHEKSSISFTISGTYVQSIK